MMTGTGTRVAIPLAVATMVLGLSTLSACAPNQAGEDGPMAADTVRGVVEIVGADPTSQIRVRMPDDVVTLTGSGADAIRQANGTEVWVAGVREDAGQLRVEAYEVRAVDGVEATDGVLEVDGNAVILVTRTGDRVRFEPAPPALQRLQGQRVWIAAPPGTEPRAWGVLSRDP